MADVECIDKATPNVKRPRIDSGSSYQSKNKIRRTSMSDELNDDEKMSVGTSLEVTSSTDSRSGDMFGGDSGFQDLTPPTSTTDCNTISFSSVSSVDSNFRGLTEVENGHSTDPQALYSAVTTTCYDEMTIDTENGLADGCTSDDAESTVSEISGLSDLSDLSGQEWKPVTGPVSWVQRQMNMGTDPRDILRELIPRGTLIPMHLDEVTLWKIIVNMLSEPPRRNKLTYVNTIDDVVHLLQKCQKIVILTGAGVSVSCGIPDFRSQDGIYARLSKDFPDLPDPQAMFDIHYFRKDPRPFFKFAKEIYPGQFQPSLSHKFIRLVEQHGKLLTNYTQNIDTLEQAAGIQRVITCHGSFASATCTRCKYKVGCEEIKEDIFNQRIPFCKKCQQDAEELAVMKPDIVFFGEGLSGDFHQAMARDKNECDLLIVMGSSLKVRPVALIPSSISPHVPQILINREPLHHLVFDVELLGDCDVIISELCRRLGNGWDHLCSSIPDLQEIRQLPDENPCQTTNEDHSECNNNNHADIFPIFRSSSETQSVEKQGNENHVFPESTVTNSCNTITEHLKPNQEPAKLDSTSEACPDSTSKFQDNDDDDDWSPKRCGSPSRQTISSRLPENTFLFVPPSRYVFHGAEVYLEDSSDHSQHMYSHMSDDSNSDASSITSCFGDSDEEVPKANKCEHQQCTTTCSCVVNQYSDKTESVCCAATTTSLDATLDDGDSGYAASKSSDLQFDTTLSCS